MVRTQHGLCSRVSPLMHSSGKWEGVREIARGPCAVIRFNGSYCFFLLHRGANSRHCYANSPQCANSRIRTVCPGNKMTNIKGVCSSPEVGGSFSARKQQTRMCCLSATPVCFRNPETAVVLADSDRLRRHRAFFFFACWGIVLLSRP